MGHFADKNSVEEGTAWERPPSSKEIKQALKHPDPKSAPPEMKGWMDFLLNVVFRAIDPRACRGEFKGVGTMEQLEDDLPQEMALAWLFLDHFSNVDNIKYNLGYTEEDGTERQREDMQKPAKKKRKKTFTKKLELKLEEENLANVEECQNIFGQVVFKSRMREWDRVCGGDRMQDGNNNPAPRANHVPRAYLPATGSRFHGQFGRMVAQQKLAGLVQGGATTQDGIDPVTNAVANELGATNVIAA